MKTYRVKERGDRMLFSTWLTETNTVPDWLGVNDVFVCLGIIYVEHVRMNLHVLTEDGITGYVFDSVWDWKEELT